MVPHQDTTNLIFQIVLQHKKISEASLTSHLFETKQSQLDLPSTFYFTLLGGAVQQKGLTALDSASPTR